jgi:hypothetical protein
MRKCIVAIKPYVTTVQGNPLPVWALPALCHREGLFIIFFQGRGVFLGKIRQ